MTWMLPPTERSLLGPQSGPVSCCDSCRVLIRAVARIADAVGYEQTAAEMRELLEEVEVVDQ